MSPTHSTAAPDEAGSRLQQAFDAHRGGALDQAERLYLSVLELAPHETRALANLGALKLQQGRAEAALAFLDQALAIKPDLPGALGNRAGALRALGRADEALESVRRALALDPEFADGLNTEGLLLTELGLPEPALVPLDKAVRLQPGHPYFWNNHGVALSRLSRHEEALASFDRAVALAPGYVEALSNRAAALRALGRLPEALAACDRVLDIEPGHLDAKVNRGCVLRDLGRAGESLAVFREACALGPDHVEAHWSLALQLLAAGRWEEGWPLFEWRWRRPDFQPLAGRFDRPPWLGATPLAGKTLLVHYEQGLGDSLQMLRYLPLLAERGARVVLAIQKPLLPLARGLAGVSQVISDGDPLPPYDLHCPLMSLPLAFGARPDSVPWPGPYLYAPAQAETVWLARLESVPRPWVGLAWSGNARHLNDRNRSLPLEALQPLLGAQASFVSVQKEYREGDRERLAALGVHDFSAELHDFGDTASLIAGLDAVVAVDTSVAHLAGAMGKPLYLLLPFAPDFRWGDEGQVSPWYPSARLLRQTSPGEWSSPLGQAAGLIAQL